MADIQFQCESCGNAVVVSQYADLTKIICRQCGEPLKSGQPQVQATPEPPPPDNNLPDVNPPEAAESQSPPKKKAKLGFRRKPAEETPPENVAQPLPEENKASKRVAARAPVIADVRELNANRPQKKFRMTVEIWALLLFLGLGSVMGYLRYGGILPLPYLRMMRDYAGVVLLVMHLAVTISAFKDSVFDGTLCLLIPGYSIYYMLLCTEDMFVRAVFAGLLVGFGHDGALQVMDISRDFFISIKAWIDSGGGSL